MLSYLPCGLSAEILHGRKSILSANNDEVRCLQ